jgi:protein-disulfide isomerase
VSSRKAQREAARAERERREQEAKRAERRKRAMMLLGAAVGVAAIVVIAIVLISRSGGDDSSTASSGDGTSLAQQGREVAQFYRGIPQKGTTLGEPSAKGTMEEFADYQCPFCAQYALEAMPTLVDQYVRDGRVKFELNMLGFLGADSQRAQQYAAAVSLQNKLYEFSELFFRNQGAENSGYVTEEFLDDLASAIPGLDVDKVKKDLESEQVNQLVTEWDNEASTLGVNSTPSFFTYTGNEDPQRLEPSQLTPDAFTQRLDEIAGGGGGGQ